MQYLIVTYEYKAHLKIESHLEFVKLVGLEAPPKVSTQGGFFLPPIERVCDKTNALVCAVMHALNQATGL